MNDLIPGQWVELFRTLDVAALVMLSVVAFALERAKTVSDTQTILILLAGGAVYGAIQGFSTYGEATSLGVFVAFVAKGVLMNAGGSYLIAQGVTAALKNWPGGGGAGPPLARRP